MRKFNSLKKVYEIIIYDEHGPCATGDSLSLQGAVRTLRMMLRKRRERSGIHVNRSIPVKYMIFSTEYRPILGNTGPVVSKKAICSLSKLNKILESDGRCYECLSLTTGEPPKFKMYVTVFWKYNIRHHEYSFDSYYDARKFIERYTCDSYYPPFTYAICEVSDGEYDCLETGSKLNSKRR